MSPAGQQTDGTARHGIQPTLAGLWRVQRGGWLEDQIWLAGWAIGDGGPEPPGALVLADDARSGAGALPSDWSRTAAPDSLQVPTGAFWRFRATLGPPADPPDHRQSRRVTLRTTTGAAHRSDWVAIPNAPRPSDLPSTDLRRRVTGSEDPFPFEIDGMTLSAKLLAAFTAAGLDLTADARVLDFGCGSGRVAKPMSERIPPGLHLLASDIDGEALEALGPALPRAEIIQHAQDPPLPIAASSVDGVYAVSVMTHLTKRDQEHWLSELRRILKPGGILLASVHGDLACRLRPLSAAEEIALRHDGISDLMPDQALVGASLDSSRYRRTFQTEAYTRAAWSRWFEILEYREGEIGTLQDLVTMRKA